MSRILASLLAALALAGLAKAADYTWANANGGNWSVGGNWSGGVVPTAADNATIGVAGTYSVTLDGFTPRSVNNLTVNQSGVVLTQTDTTLTVGGAFALSAGQFHLNTALFNGLTVSGSMTTAVGSTLTWTGGTIGGTGTYLLGGTTTLAGSNSRALNSLLTVGPSGTFSLNGGSVGISIGGSGGLQVQSGGLVTLAASGTVLAGFQNSTLTNAGTVRKTGGTASAVEWVVNSTGTIDVQTGSTLTLQNGGSLSGTTEGNGTLRLTLGTFTTPNTTTLTNSGVLTMEGATLTTAGTGAITSTGTINLNSGSLAPTTGGSLTLGGSFSWSGGVLTGPGTTTITGTGNTSMSVLAGKSLAGTLTIGSGGSLTLNAGTIPTTTTGAGITVQAGGLLNIRTEGAVLSASQPGTLTNAGIVRKSTGTGNAQLDWTLVNSGTFDVQSGSVTFSTGSSGAGVVTNTGTLTMSDGARIGSGIGGFTITNNAGGLMRGPAGGTGTYGGGGFGRQFVFNNGSTLAPGGTASAGRLILFGDLTMNGGSTFHQSLNGNTATTGFDRVEVTGVVNLDGATLTGDTTGFNPTPADRYFILLNDLTDPVTGTFAGLPQDGTGTLGQYHYQISYQGDSLTNNLTGGNDVVLYNFTPVPEPGALLTVAVAGIGLVAAARRLRRNKCV